MGIDIHALNFLRYAKNKSTFADTVTIGRQGIHVIEPVVRSTLKTKPDYHNEVYCENLLTEYFGASSVESIDNSAYENASIIHDMNAQVPSSLTGRFNTIIDGGCLEHIFNIPQALKNCSIICKEGGQIIHILPANNYCGHGFWQFSPELFFSLYSAENGYDQTEVFMADLSNTKAWYKVIPPSNGKRVNVRSSNQLYVLVRTTLRTREFSHSNVQQSDYAFEWDGLKASKDPSPDNRAGIKQMLERIPFLYGLLSSAYHTYLSANDGLNRRNPGLTFVEVSDLVK
jgi:hypothetical protein